MNKDVVLKREPYVIAQEPIVNLLFNLKERPQVTLELYKDMLQALMPRQNFDILRDKALEYVDEAVPLVDEELKIWQINTYGFKTFVQDLPKL